MGRGGLLLGYNEDDFSVTEIFFAASVFGCFSMIDTKIPRRLRQTHNPAGLSCGSFGFSIRTVLPHCRWAAGGSFL